MRLETVTTDLVTGILRLYLININNIIHSYQFIMTINNDHCDNFFLDFKC